GRRRRRTRGSGQGPEGCGVVRPRCAHGPGCARPRREAPVTGRAGAPPAQDAGAPPARDAAPVGLVLLDARPPAERATLLAGALRLRLGPGQETFVPPAADVVAAAQADPDRHLVVARPPGGDPVAL